MEALQEVKQRADETQRRVEAIEANLSAQDETWNWQQQYNQQLLDQRVKEELEKKQRFEELERREAAREERARKNDLDKEIDKITTHFRKLKQLRKNGPVTFFRCFFPFGKVLHWEMNKTLNGLLAVGSHGYLGLWKYGKGRKGDDRLGPITEEDKKTTDGFTYGGEQPTLVDYVDISREVVEDPHLVTSVSLCRDMNGKVPSEVLEHMEMRRQHQLKQQKQREEEAKEAAAAGKTEGQDLVALANAAAAALGQSVDSINAPETDNQFDALGDIPMKRNVQEETILVFTTSVTGRGSFTLVTLTSLPRLVTNGPLATAEMKEYTQMMRLFESDPSEAIQQMKMDLDTEGFRWVKSSTVVSERSISSGPILTSEFSPSTNTILVAMAGGTIRCLDFQLRNLWAFQVSSLLQPSNNVLTSKPTMSKFSSRRLTNNLAMEEPKYQISSMTSTDRKGTDFLVGLEDGTIFLLQLPKDDILALAAAQEGKSGNGSTTMNDAPNNGTSNLGAQVSGTGNQNGSTEQTFSRLSKLWLDEISASLTRRETSNALSKSQAATTRNLSRVIPQQGSSLSSGESTRTTFGSFDPSLLKILTTDFGGKASILCKLDAAVTCLQVCQDMSILAGRSDGFISNIQAGAEKLIVEYQDKLCIGGENGPIVDILPLNQGSTVISCDAMGHIRCFSKTKLVAISKSDDANPRKLLFERDANLITQCDEDGNQSSYWSVILLGEDSWTNWHLHRASPGVRKR